MIWCDSSHVIFPSPHPYLEDHFYVIPPFNIPPRIFPLVAHQWSQLSFTIIHSTHLGSSHLVSLVHGTYLFSCNVSIFIHYFLAPIFNHCNHDLSFMVFNPIYTRSYNQKSIAYCWPYLLVFHSHYPSHPCLLWFSQGNPWVPFSMTSSSIIVPLS